MMSNEIWSEQSIEKEFQDNLLPPFEGKESEDNWQQRELSLGRLRSLLKDPRFTESPALHSALKHTYLENICISTQSLRSAIVSAACALISDLSTFGGPQLIDPLLERLVMSLLKLTAQSKKLIVNMASNTMFTVLSNSSFSQRIFTLLVDSCLAEKSPFAREKQVEFIYTLLKRVNSSSVLAISAHIDKLLIKTLSDSNATVRETSRQIFKSYENLCNQKALNLLEILDNTVKKALKRDKSGGSIITAPTPPIIKKPVKVKQADIPVAIFAAPKPKSPIKRETVRTPENNYIPQQMVELSPIVAFENHDSSFTIIKETTTPKKPTPQRRRLSEPRQTPTKPKDSPKGGLVRGFEVEKPVPLTPLLNPKPQFNPVALPNTPITPGSDFETRLEKILHGFRANAISEKLCRRICRLSKSFANDSMPATDKQKWRQNFPEIVKMTTNAIRSKQNRLIDRENLIITLKHCVLFHPQLFSGTEDWVLAECCLPVWTEAEANLEFVAAVEDAVEVCMKKFPVEISVQILIDCLQGANDQMAGHVFKCLSMAVKNLTETEGVGDIHPIEKSIVIPLFQHSLINKFITCPNVLTRMSVYSLLIDCWKILGDTFTKQYLTPVKDDDRGKGLMNGLKLPCYKLFQTLLEQQQNN